MPNWCSNTLTVTGPADEIERFRKESTGVPPQYTAYDMETGEERAREPEAPGLLNFHSLVPVPDEVLKFGFSHQYERDEDGKPKKDESGRLAQKKGLCGYDAQIKLWGTKWGACEVQETHSDSCTNYTPPTEKDSDEWVSYQFDTAWSPPEKWVVAVSPLFPECVFTLSYMEEGCDFQGCLMLKGKHEIVNETTNVTFLSMAHREDEHYAWDVYDIHDKLAEANGER